MWPVGSSSSGERYGLEHARVVGATRGDTTLREANAQTTMFMLSVKANGTTKTNLTDVVRKEHNEDPQPQAGWLCTAHPVTTAALGNR